MDRRSDPTRNGRRHHRGRHDPVRFQGARPQHEDPRPCAHHRAVRDDHRQGTSDFVRFVNAVPERMRADGTSRDRPEVVPHSSARQRASAYSSPSCGEVPGLMNVDLIDRRSFRRGASDAMSANLMEAPTRTGCCSTAPRQGRDRATRDAPTAHSSTCGSSSRFTDVLDRARAAGSWNRISPDAEIQIDKLLTGPRSSSRVRRSCCTSGRSRAGAKRRRTAHLTSCSSRWRSFELAKEVIFGVSDVGIDSAAARALGVPDEEIARALGPLEALRERLMGRGILRNERAQRLVVAGDHGDVRGRRVLLLHDLRRAALRLLDLERHRADVDLLAAPDGHALSGREAVAAHENVMVKITSPQVPRPVAVDGSVRAELDRVIALTQQGKWRDASTGYEIGQEVLPWLRSS